MSRKGQIKPIRSNYGQTLKAPENFGYHLLDSQNNKGADGLVPSPYRLL